MVNLILVGGGGHCESAIEVIESQHRFYTIKGILDIKQEGFISGYPILGKDDLIPGLSEDNQFVITVGSIKSTLLRKNLANKIEQENGKLALIVSSYANVSKRSKIGDGTIIFHNVVINAASCIGGNCIINTAAVVEHDCKIGNFVHISTGAMVNGSCTIGSNCFIGSNATIANGVSICDNTIVGAGTVIMKDINDAGTYVGNPARKVNNFMGGGQL